MEEELTYCSEEPWLVVVPTPQALKDLAGNPGKRPSREASAERARTMSLVARVRCQDGMARLAAELELLGLLGSTDQAALAGYCTAYANLVKAQRLINSKGFTYTHNGLAKKRPEVQIAQDAMREMRKYAQEFGMTPSSRSKVTPNQLPLPGVPGKPQMPQLPGVGDGASADPNERFFGSPGLRAVK
jgi:P27 family predicted phage terminase small subunit